MHSAGVVSETGTDALTVDAVAAAALVGVSRSHFYDLHKNEMVPAPMQLGRSVRWGRAELVAWVNAKCPPRAEWEKQWKAGGAS